MQKQLMVLIVWLILNGKVERAVEIMSAQFAVNVPKIRVGLPKGRKNKALGCYSAKDRTISVLDSDTLKDPFVILHEFYHHLRTTPDRRHKGTEKLADKFALEFIAAYKSMANESGNY